MKRTWFIFGLVLLFAFNVSAQSEYAIKQAIDFFHSNKMQRGDWNKLLTESDIEGSPYLNDEFIKVRFTLLPSPGLLMCRSGTISTANKLNFFQAITLFKL